MSIKSIKIKLEKKCEKPCSYIHSVIEFLTLLQFEIIADSTAR